MPIINVNGHSIETDENGKPYWDYKFSISLARFLLKNKIIKITFNEDDVSDPDYVWMNLHTSTETISIDQQAWEEIIKEGEFILKLNSNGLVDCVGDRCLISATLKAYDDWMKKEDHDYKEYERLKKKFG